jgi:hypothetical protein
MRQASSSARIEGLEATDATKSLMIAYADGKITSGEAGQVCGRRSKKDHQPCGGLGDLHQKPRAERQRRRNQKHPADCLDRV